MDGTLKDGEFHPAAHIALSFVKDYLKSNDHFLLIESLSCTALSGNRLAEIALTTLQRFLKNEPVSDRYLMGLAWMLYAMGKSKD